MGRLIYCANNWIGVDISFHPYKSLTLLELEKKIKSIYFLIAYTNPDLPLLMFECFEHLHLLECSNQIDYLIGALGRSSICNRIYVHYAAKVAS